MVKKLKDVIATFVSNFLDLSREYRRIKDQLGRARKDNEKLERQNRALQQDSEDLKIIKHETDFFTGFRAVNSFYRVSQL